jgi:hypothetical protein
MYLTPPPQSPLARIATAIVGAAIMVGAFMIGMVAFVILLGVGAVMALWFWFRTRDVRRAFREAAEQTAAEGPAATPSEPIEAEYTVVTHRDPEGDGETS